MENPEFTVTITQERYEQLLDMATRVNVAVERICNDEYIETEDILRILGTKSALRAADEIKEEGRKNHEEYLRRTGLEDADL